MSLFDTDLQTSPRVTVANLNRARGSAHRVFETPVEPIAFKMPPTLTAEIVPFQRPVPVVAPVARPAPGAYGMIGKRLLDIALVVLSAPLWLPLVALFALLVARDGHNPFYTQSRVGRNGDVFRMFKLRSMVPDAEAKLEAHLAADPAARAEWDATQKLKNDPRITRIGRIIRKASLDELPQMFNVLLGDMSLVGPRPFMVSQDALYDGRAYYRLRPGLTGLWQVSDRNECNFIQRVDFDEAYGQIMSLRTDVAVLWRTVAVVLRGTVLARGFTSDQIADRLSSSIASNFATRPNVFVSVAGLREVRPATGGGPAAPPTISVFFMGEVGEPGERAVAPGTTFLQGLSQSGGLTNFANARRIQLRRTDPHTGAESVHTINYRALERGARLQQNLVLAEGDVILVPQRGLFE